MDFDRVFIWVGAAQRSTGQDFIEELQDDKTFLDNRTVRRFENWQGGGSAGLRQKSGVARSGDVDDAEFNRVLLTAKRQQDFQALRERAHRDVIDDILFRHSACSDNGLTEAGVTACHGFTQCADSDE